MTIAERSERIRALLAFLLIGSFISTLQLLMFKNIPAANKEIITYILGQISGMTTTALAFYYTKGVGQDDLDTRRTETTGRLADAITATAQAATAQASQPPQNAEEKKEGDEP